MESFLQKIFHSGIFPPSQGSVSGANTQRGASFLQLSLKATPVFSAPWNNSVLGVRCKLAPMPNQKTSVWRHYNEIAEGRKRVGACKYCGQTYANNATRMKRHLTTCKKCPEPIKSSYRQLLQTREGFTSWKTRRHQGTGTWVSKLFGLFF